MRSGIVGLGRRGANLARHAMEKGHHVVGYNLDPVPTQELSSEGNGGHPVHLADEGLQRR